MLGFSFARFVGIVVLLISTIYLVIQLGDRNWGMAGVVFFVLLGGLWLAFWGDHRMKNLQMQVAKQRKQEGESFQGYELDVGLRWLKWCLLAFVLGSVVALFWGLMLPDLWRSGLRGKALLMAVLGVLLLQGGMGMLWLGAHALRGDGLLKVGPLGLQIASWPLLAWRQLHGADLQEVDRRGIKQWQLVLVLDESFRAQMPSRWWVMGIQWPLVRWSPKRGLLRVPMAFLNENPHRVLQAIREVGARQGAQLVEGWRHTQSIEEAREDLRHKRAADEAFQEEVAHQLKTALRDGPLAGERLSQLALTSQRMVTGLDQMDSMQISNTEHPSDRWVWALYFFLWTVFASIMVWVVVRITQALIK
jgi:hypothetical protein